MSRLVSPLFAGRETELSVLAGAFDDGAGGTLRAVLVGAEAGGGKSRLVREFAERVRGHALVLTGGCVEQSAAQARHLRRQMGRVFRALRRTSDAASRNRGLPAQP